MQSSLDRIRAELKLVEAELAAKAARRVPVRDFADDPAGYLRMIEWQLDRLEKTSLLENRNSSDRAFPTLEADFDPDAPAANKPLRICILTQDILGPIKNGGIGTAYYHAARLLAAAGHELTICFVHPKAQENQALERWKAFYEKFGIDFTGVTPNGGTSSALGKTIRASATAWRWLKKQHRFDIVHVSEWHGLGYYAQLARHLGMAFEDTHFVVKGSSPTLWNHQGNRQLINDEGFMGYAFMERRSAELADTLICGSQHLLDWMRGHGYALNQDRCFAHPNIFLAEADLIRPGHHPHSERQPVREIVFFGRLEPRKGLLLFCDALNALCDQGVELPPVTFVGRPVPRFAARSYIKKQQKKWNTRVEIKPDFDAREAIQYLAKKNCLAVIASLLENSSIAVYECLSYHIPFIACASGGTSELIRKQDRPHVLFRDHHVELAKLLKQVIESGAFMARPRWDLEKTNQLWLEWHARLPIRLEHEQKELRGRKMQIRADPGTPKVTICLTHFNRRSFLQQALDSIHAQDYKNFDVVLVDDGSTCEKALEYLSDLEPEFKKRGWRIIRQSNLYLGAARNTAVRHASGELIIFFDDDNVMKENYISTMVDAMQYSGADILTSFSSAFSGKGAPGSPKSKFIHEIRFLGAAADWGFFRNVAGDAACLMKRKVFEELGGFTEAYKVGRDDMEFYNRAILHGYKLEVIPEALYHYRCTADTMRNKHSTFESGIYRSITPYLEVSPPQYQAFLKYASYLYLHKEKTFRRDMGQFDIIREKIGEWIEALAFRIRNR